jgi:hypothetical protein
VGFRIFKSGIKIRSTEFWWPSGPASPEPVRTAHCRVPHAPLQLIGVVPRDHLITTPIDLFDDNNLINERKTKLLKYLIARWNPGVNHLANLLAGGSCRRNCQLICPLSQCGFHVIRHSHSWIPCCAVHDTSESGDRPQMKYSIVHSLAGSHPHHSHQSNIFSQASPFVMRSASITSVGQHSPLMVPFPWSRMG